MKDFTHLSIDNLEYVEQMLTQYRENPSQVTGDWKYFFEGVELSRKFQKGNADFEREMKVVNLIEAYRLFGHLNADVDPLGMTPRRPEVFQLSRFGLTEKDLDASFEAGRFLFQKEAKLKEIIQFLEKTYCGTLSVQFEGVTPEIREWILKEVEQTQRKPFSTEEKKEIFDELVRAEGMEKFLHTRYVGVKRFSVEGSENIIPILNTIIDRSAQLGTTDAVLGMAHRGRLNILVNFMGKSMKNLFAEFDGKETEGMSWFTSDVKYHMGYSIDKKTMSGKTVHLSLAFNPSHLEAVNPVVEGIAWLKQRQKGPDNVLPILIHGDAAFIGQGVVSETLQMSRLEAYSTGGTIHLAIDNQVGFTTNPRNSRSSVYCSDVMRPLQVPVFHVNGDDAEACVKAAELAVLFRNKFKKDICIRLSSYRRHGHNEGDEPIFTQPLMYEKIKSHPTPREQYQKTLEQQGVLPSGEGNKIFDAEISRLQTILDDVRANPPKLTLNRGQGAWKGFKEVNIEEVSVPSDTKMDVATLTQLTKSILTTPTDVELLPKLKNVVDKKLALFNEKKILDWGAGELLAYAALLSEGHNVRLVGQDAQRGTFSHRHSVYHDYKTGKSCNFLNKINPGKAEFHVYDSFLSEFAALGFEYGVSTANPHWLTIWEAQFGDFSNGAQIIIDQFISSAEQKWQQMSGLVMLLPHGYEGQGPEHSSARLERYLQLCAQGNMQVCYVTTPAQVFHMLRRQIKRDVRKPLIVMTPKSLLRHPKVLSHIDEFAKGSFQEAIGDDTIKDTKKVKRAILCTGKIYYDLLDRRSETKMDEEVVLLRAEQIYPFPHADLMADLKRYSNLKEIIWAQEEPENMGALFFVRSKMNRLKAELGRKDISLGYIARPERSSPATGSPYKHKAEQEEILVKAFHLNGGQ